MKNKTTTKIYSLNSENAKLNPYLKEKTHKNKN